MNQEQFDNWWILEGLGAWTLCDRGTRVSINAPKDAPTRWALRSATHAVYMSVGKVKRSKFAAKTGRDTAAHWTKADIGLVPWSCVEALVDLARNEKR